jgi:hypothetical protein
VPSIYSLMWAGEFVTLPSPPFMQLKPHFEATTALLVAFACKKSSFRTEDLVPDIVLLDEITQQLFIDTSSIHNGSVPERTS